LFVEALEVFGECAPIDGEAESPEEIFLFFDLAFVDGRDRLALTGDLGCHSHHHFAHRTWIDEQVRF
jgi:hypothetical protein